MSTVAEDEEPVAEVSKPRHRGPQSPRTDDHTRTLVFEAVKRNDYSAIESTISKSPYSSVYDQSLLEPGTGKNALHLAIELNKIELAEKLIDQANESTITQVFADSSASKNVLQMATYLGNQTLVEHILSKISKRKNKIDFIEVETRVEISGQRPRTLTSFHLAAFNGLTELVKYYLEIGINVNILNAKNDTALLWASRWGHENTVNFLLTQNADVSLQNDKKSTALHWAVRYQQKRTVKLLLTIGRADPNQKRVMGLVAPLFLAASMGNTKIAKLLIEHGADVNMVIRGGEYPLHHASKEGHDDIVKMLIKHGAKISQEDEGGNTAIILAATMGHDDVVETLINNGADMYHQNHNGNDAWRCAMDSTETGVLELLTDRYLLVKDNNEGIELKSPLVIATEMGNTDVIKILLSMRVNPKDVDSDGNTLIHHAALNDHSEVLELLSRKVDINAQNKKKDTALHIACNKGYQDVAETLLQLKAAANKGNSKGETALHVAAYSTCMNPDLARSIMQHTIKTHDWASVNGTDNYGNNALHLASKFAKPDVLWEFRFVRFKDIDDDGNTALHEAVRPRTPEALDIMLDIYEDMQRDADLNTLNNNQESVLHLAASEGFSQQVDRLIFYGADVTLKDGKGNTVLHRLVKQMTSSDHGEELKLMDVIKVVVNNCVRWWCTEKRMKVPTDDPEIYQQYKRQAILYLVHDIRNKTNNSVMAYAFKYGANKFLEFLMTMPDVMMFQVGEKIYYDVSNVTPSTNISDRKSTHRMSNSNKVSVYDQDKDATGRYVHAVANIELLVSLEKLSRASQVLDIAPVRQVERMYTSICAWAYAFFLILHVVYMSVYTYIGIDISAKFRNITALSYSDSHVIAAYVIVPLEPIVLLTLFLAYMYRLFRGVDKLNSSVLVYIIIIIYATLSITWLGLIGHQHSNHDYVLAVALCIGWLGSLSFTRGFKGIHYFYKMLIHMIFNDVFRFAIVFGFVLVAFSFAFHALFQVSDSIATTYETPGDTLFLSFNMMLGMAEIFDADFDSGMAAVGRTATFAKVVYLFYIALSAIILLNLLIAMMNDSYSTILRGQKVAWRMDAILLGIGVEKLMPWFLRVFGRVKIQKMTPTWTNSSDKRWFLVTNSATLDKYAPEVTSFSQNEKNIKNIEITLNNLDAKVLASEHTIKDTSERMDEIMKSLNKIHEQLKK